MLAKVDPIIISGLEFEHLGVSLSFSVASAEPGYIAISQSRNHLIDHTISGSKTPGANGNSREAG